MRHFFILFSILMLSLSVPALSQINTPAGAVHPFNSNSGYSFGIMPTNLPISGIYLQSQDAADAYNLWKTNYVRACGSQYRVLFDDGSSTVSEGIGYGMLLAAYAADKTLFDGLWAYYKTSSDGNGLMNWKMSGCTGVAGSGSATDADEDAAMALIVAACQWPAFTSPYNYNTEANTLITALGNKEVVPASNQINNGDGWGFSGTCRNPSYFAPGYYRMFAGQVAAQATLWNNAAAASYTLLNANVNTTTGLVSNWSDNNGVTNNCNGGNVGWYGYDACRNPLRMATDYIWYGTAAAQTNFCNKIATYCQGKGATSVGGDIAQSGGTGSHVITFISTFAAGICGSGPANQTLMDQMYSETVATSDNLPYYFGNTLKCLSLFMMSGNFWKPCGAVVTPVNVSITSPVDNTVMNEGSNLVINATASTMTGSISKVDFYANGILIGTSTTSPYTYTWTSLLPGNYQLTAIATNSSAQTATSATVNIQVIKVVYSTSTVPTIDGTIEASWGNYPTTSITKVIVPTISSSSDLSATFQGRWDATNFYILMNVTDDVKKNDSPASNLYDDDGVEIYIDINNDKASTYGANDFQYAFRWNDANVYENKHNAITGVVLGQTTTATGYILEVKIPWSTLTLGAPAAGIKIGYDVMINDDDDGGSRDGKMSWNAAADNAWQDPSLFGTVILGGTPPVTCTAPGATITAGGATTFCTGGNVILNANIGTGLTFQWKNGATAIAGATAASYSATTSGSYTVDVSSGTCTSTSAATTVIVNPLPAVPTITAGGPTSFCSGGSVVLSTSAIGVTYQWNNNGTAVAGATTSSYTAVTTSTYTVTVTSLGCSSISTGTNVTANPLPAMPTITTAGPTTFCSGGNVVLSTGATGVTFQWNNGGTAIAGATAATYTATTSGIYTITVNTSGCSNTSAGTAVTVNPLPAVPTITAGGSTSFCAGGNVVLSTSATGVTFQWSNGGTAIAGATTATYTTTTSGTYTITVSTSGCSSSSVGTAVTVNPLPTIPTITAGGPTSFCSGGNVVLSTGATGVTYQWKNGGMVIAGATASSYTAATTGTYTVTVTSLGCSSTSAGTNVTTNPLPAVPTITAGGSTSFCAGGNVVLSTGATGVTYQWKNGGTVIAGATASSYTATTTGTYTVTVTSLGCSSTSVGTNVTANLLPAVPTITAGGPTTFCSGGNVVLSTGATGVTFQWSNGGTAIAGATAATYTATTSGTYTITVSTSGCSSISAGTAVTANLLPAVPTITAGGSTSFCSGGNVVLSTGATGVTYQWKNGGTAITGATASSYTATTTGTYTVTVTSLGCSSTSAGTAVTANLLPAVPTITTGGPTTFCSGGNVVLSTGATGVTFQWSNGGTAIAGATAATYTATTSGTYTITVNTSGCSSISAGTAVTVNPLPAVPTITAGGPTSFCSGGSVVLSTSAIGVTYQWNNNGTAVAGASTSSYTAATTSTYTVTVTSLGCSSISAGTNVTANPLPAVPTITAGSPTTFCSGGNVVLSTGATGVTFQWNNGGTAIAGATAATYTATTSGTYMITVNTSGCSNTSAGMAVTNASPPIPTINAGGSTTFCSGGNVVLSTGATGVTYQWKNGSTSIAGAIAASFTVTTSGIYTVMVSASGCSSTSAATTVTVSSSVTASVNISSNATSICSGTSVDFTATPASGVPSPTYQWRKNGSNISGAASSLYSATGISNGDAFTCVMSSTGSCVTGAPATSNSISILVSNQPTLANAGPDQYVTTNNATLAANNPSIGTGVWTLVNGSGIFGNSGSPTSSVSGLGVGANTFRWKITSGPCNPSSNDVIINLGSAPATSAISGPSVLANNSIGGTYSVNNNPGSTYVWTVPVGAVITSGQGTNTITINFGTTDGNITVTETNLYGSTTVSKLVDLGIPPSSGGTISGPTNVANNTTSVTYSVPNNAGSSYAWTVPAGAVITSGQGTNTITVDFGTSSGSVGVTETNLYGSGFTTKTINVGPPPATSSVSGPDTVGYNQTGVVYSVSAHAGSGYVWTLPSGATIVSGQGTNSIVVNFGNSGGNIAVTESNNFGSNNASLLVVAGTPPSVTSITGATSVSPGQTYTYSVTNDPLVTYNWSVPPGATIISGQGTNTITVNYGVGAVSGNVSLTETSPYGTASATSSVTMSPSGIFSSYLSDPSSVYPNPFFDQVTIRINSTSIMEVVLKVTDLKGTEVFSSSGYNTNEEIQLGSELKSGMYIVRAFYASKMSLIKVIKME